jgi:Caspase domain
MDGSRSALVVASDTYVDPSLSQLHAPASDAEALAAVLRDPMIGDFQVSTLMNEPAHEVNLAVEEFFADRRPDDLLLVHFSCHGVKDESGELYFAMTNTLLRRLGATGVSAEFVNRRMTRSRSRRVVLLLDCCYAGAFDRGMTARAGSGVGIETQFGGRGRAVITASSAMEYAFEGEVLADSYEPAPSVFTSALVEGLQTGEADRDEDGLVALDELYDYVYDRVRTTTPNQTPGKWTFGVEGELIIARRSRPVTTAAPLPPELEEAIDNPLAAVRAVAVQELGRLLGGRHAGLALGARVALERLSNDDSRRVAAAAADLLAGTAAAVAGPDSLDAPPRGSGGSPPAVAPGKPAPATSGSTAPLVQPAEPIEPPSRSPAAPAVPLPERAARPRRPVAADHARGPGSGLALPAAGGVAIVSAVLMVVSLFPAFVQTYHLADRSENALQTLLASALALVAGIALLMPRTRRTVGPALLLPAAAASVISGVYDLIVADTFGRVGAGFWLHLVAQLATVLACCLAGVAVRRAGDVRVGLRGPHGAIPKLVATAGVAGAILLVLQVVNETNIPGLSRPYRSGQDLAVLIVAAAAAVLLPAAAAVALPRQFGVALLLGWVAAGGSLAIFYTDLPTSAFGLTLLALLALSAPLYRSTPAALDQVSAP